MFCQGWLLRTSLECFLVNMHNDSLLGEILPPPLRHRLLSTGSNGPDLKARPSCSDPASVVLTQSLHFGFLP